MRLSFNEIRARAARFAADYADATYEKGETQTFQLLDRDTREETSFALSSASGPGQDQKEQRAA